MELLTNLHNAQLTWALADGESRQVLILNPENLTLHVSVPVSATFRCWVLNFDGHSSQNDITVDIVGEGGTVGLFGLALCQSTEQVANLTHVTHHVGGGSSEQLFKFVLDGTARGTFLGELHIVPDAQQTQAYQTNRNLLLSPEAKMRTKPQLEIYADDVKASHGASTGQMNDQALFYMQQRGISRDDAMAMLTNAFLADVLNTIPDDSLRDNLTELIATLLTKESPIH